jgi:hypothetical protein
MSAQTIPIEIDEYLLENKVTVKEKLHMIVADAINLEVTTDDGFKRMTNMYSESKEWEKRIEYLRKEANRPDQNRISGRNDKAQEILGPLKQIQTIAKQKCEKYQLLLEQQKAYEQQQMVDAADVLGLDDVPMVAPLDKSIRGDGALMFTRTVKKFRTVDLSKVPLKYLQVNEDLIKQDMNLGVSEIAGIEIYEEKVTQLRTR